MPKSNSQVSYHNDLDDDMRRYEDDIEYPYRNFRNTGQSTSSSSNDHFVPKYILNQLRERNPYQYRFQQPNEDPKASINANKNNANNKNINKYSYNIHREQPFQMQQQTVKKSAQELALSDRSRSFNNYNTTKLTDFKVENDNDYFPSTNGGNSNTKNFIRQKMKSYDNIERNMSVYNGTPFNNNNNNNGRVGSNVNVIVVNPAKQSIDYEDGEIDDDREVRTSKSRSKNSSGNVKFNQQITMVKPVSSSKRSKSDRHLNNNDNDDEDANLNDVYDKNGIRVQQKNNVKRSFSVNQVKTQEKNDVDHKRLFKNATTMKSGVDEDEDEEDDDDDDDDDDEDDDEYENENEEHKNGARKSDIHRHRKYSRDDEDLDDATIYSNKSTRNKSKFVSNLKDVDDDDEEGDEDEQKIVKIFPDENQFSNRHNNNNNNSHHRTINHNNNNNTNNHSLAVNGFNFLNEQQTNEMQRLQEFKSTKILSEMLKLVYTKKNTIDFILKKPTSYDAVIKCHIRKTGTVSKVYTMFVELPDGSELAVMQARRKKASTRLYIWINALEYNNIDNDESTIELIDSYMNIPFGKLKSKNKLKVVYDKFILTNNGKKKSEKKPSFIKRSKKIQINGEKESQDSKIEEIYKEFLAIDYENSIFKISQPLKFLINLYNIPNNMLGNTTRQFSQNRNNNQIMDGESKLKTKEPKFDKDKRRYVLDFNRRVTIASATNFQVCSIADEDRVILQVGKSNYNEYICDYSYPLNAFEAFGIALSSFFRKIM